jgi:hypothetical protein
MAKKTTAKKSEARTFVAKPKKRLKRHAKKDSKNKGSDRYKKPNVGQGK